MATRQEHDPSPLDVADSAPLKHGGSSKHIEWLWSTAQVSAGVLVCLITALLTTALVGQSRGAEYVPLGFAVVALVVAAIFGRLAGLLGAFVGTCVFAYELYPPLGSFRIDNSTARQNLAWMILCTLVLCFLVFPPANRSQRS